MAIAASAFFSQWFRVYSPISFGKKWDKNGDHIRKFCPELKDFPAKYIYEPWKAPAAEQKKAGCIIGQDYPKPIVDEKLAKESCMAKMKHAYQVNKHGSDPEVLDGTIGQSFSDDHAAAVKTAGQKRKARENGSGSSVKKGKTGKTQQGNKIEGYFNTTE